MLSFLTSKLKRAVACSCALILCVGLTPAGAAEEITVTIDGAKLTFADQAPVMVNDRVLVPMRAIFEALGAEVSWDDAAQQATAVKGGVIASIAIGASALQKNAEKIALDSPAILLNGRTLVPVRAVSEAFGANVSWDEKSLTVIIVTASTEAASSESANAGGPGGIQNDYRIVWDETSGTKISHEVKNAQYGRMCVVSADVWLVAYAFGPHNGVGDGWSNVGVRRTTDAGKTWSEPFVIPRPENGWRTCTPDFIKLSDGRILLAYTVNRNPETNENCTFEVRYSDDGGVAWSAPSVAGYGRGWEPAMMELPDGTVQLFYASEARWWKGAGSDLKQEILMVESTDRGVTWNARNPKRVAYNLNQRDGMPVPVLLKDNMGAAFVIESVGAPKSPYVIWTPDPKNWQSVEENATGPGSDYRWLATEDNIFGGAPYIMQLPSGVTVMACHHKGYKESIIGWRRSVAMVYLGDEKAQNFQNLSYPYPKLAKDEGTIENAVYAVGDDGILIVSTFVSVEGVAEIRYKTGKVEKINN